MTRQSSKESKHFNDDRSLQEYSKAWHEKMVKIWLDRYNDFEIGIHPPQNSTGDLRKSITPAGYQADALEAEMRFKFLQYGIYVDLGTARATSAATAATLNFWAETTERSIIWAKPESRARGLANRGTSPRR